MIAVDGGVASAVFGPLEILQACNAIRTNLVPEHQATITSEILSTEGGSFVSSNGHRLPTDGPLRTLPPQSVVFFPGFGAISPQMLIEKLAAYAFLGDWLREQHERGCILATGCNGNFLFVEAGLLQVRV